MLFTDIRLQNFRSYQEASFELDPGVNIVVGPNAAGKTNLLEALMVGAVGKSYRARDSLLIKHGEQWARIDIHTDRNSTRVVKVSSSEAGRVDKLFEFDEKIYKRMTNDTRLPVVLFEPDNMRLLNADPAERRTYLDDLLEQIAPSYAKLRGDFKRVVSQRNALLKSHSPSESQVFAWNIRFCELATEVVRARHDLLVKINEQLDDVYSSISKKKLDLSVTYFSKTPLEDYSNQLMKQLTNDYELDRARGFTGRGPQRDDMIIYSGQTALSETASRGENRSLVLALKIIELIILEEATSRRPLLLLDDVFSELDGARRSALTKLLKNYQTIITTTDADILGKGFSSRSSIIVLG